MGKGKLLAGLAAMFAIYVAAEPYIAVHQMKYAAEIDGHNGWSVGTWVMWMADTVCGGNLHGQVAV